jgi:hypothetical protein
VTVAVAVAVALARAVATATAVAMAAMTAAASATVAAVAAAAKAAATVAVLTVAATTTLPVADMAKTPANFDGGTVDKRPVSHRIERAASRRGVPYDNGDNRFLRAHLASIDRLDPCHQVSFNMDVSGPCLPESLGTRHP